MESSLHPTLYARLAIASEPITPSQTSLLKIIDSHLAQDHDDPPACPHAFLLSSFLNLSEYAIFSMRSGVDDGRLPRVLEALVLVGESLGSVGLAVQGRKDRAEVNQGGENDLVTAMKDVEGGVVKAIVGTLASAQVMCVADPTEMLGQLKEFVPRLRPDPANPVSTEAPSERSLSGIKVTLVKLIGVLSYEDTKVGDQVREAGGIQLILGMTEVDELNPCKSFNTLQ